MAATAKLLREYLALDYDKNLIKEAIEKKQPVTVKALLQRADAQNQNKRVYPREILMREVMNYEKAVKEGRALGELDHPDSSIVALENASHLIREIWWDGDEVHGTVEILPTPKGKIAMDLLGAGVKLGISSRGVGETVNNGESEVVDESFMLICFDLVSEPSTHEAWLMSESKVVDMQNLRKMIPKNDRINRIVNEILNR